MENQPNFKKRVAECVGLWLAEGDTKTRLEVTFTNNCPELINLFYKTINKLFKDHKYNLRIYIYSNEDTNVNLSYNCIIKNYIDNRARKPYFIVRLASVEVIKKWKEIIEEITKDKSLYPYILRGFFAGEGNIKTGSHKARVIRIAQGSRNIFLEEILNYLAIKRFSFRLPERSYVIHGKWNWDIFAKIRLADLHPDKKERFWISYNSYKEEHYENNYLIKNIFQILEVPHTTKKLSTKFNRSFARIQDVLIKLKKQRRINNYRVHSRDYWTKDNNLIIISKVKNKYLFYLTMPRRTSEIAKKFKVCPKNAFKRLKELEKLNLVKRESNKKWIRIPIRKKILFI